jgi:hypothetical protein
VVLPLPRGTKTTAWRKRRVVVPRSTKPKRLAKTKRCHAIRRSGRPASGPLMLGICPANSSAASTRPSSKPHGPAPASAAALSRRKRAQASRASLPAGTVPATTASA